LDVQKSLILDLVATLWVIAISLFFVSRALGLPIAALAAAQRRLEGGDLSSRAEVMADNELGQLAISFNTMALELGERAGLRRAFEQFVDPHVLASILHEGGLAPISRDATIMFTDIASFTGWAEALSPAEAFEQLNDYFIELTGLIRFHGGTVNNFVGDGVVALFNLPRLQNDHAGAALRAALAVRNRMRERRENGQFGPITRIGIHTGAVYAGIIGDAVRRSFSVYGDAVNIAARLEQLNKEFNTDILLSRQTAELIDNKLALTKIGEFSLRGRVGKIDVLTC
jgi:class 3 adenylate cyclase